MNMKHTTLLPPFSTRALTAGALLLLSLLPASCVQDEQPEDILRDNALQISAVQMATATVEPATRALNPSALTTEGARIGLFLPDNPGTGYTAITNRPFTYTATGGWQPATEADLVQLNAYTTDLYAYYPYNEAYTDVTALPLTSGPATGTGAVADICFVKKTDVSSAQKKVTLDMTHALALLQLNFQFSSKEYAGQKVKKIILESTVTAANFYSTATVNITDIIQSGNGTAPDIPDYNNFVAAPGGKLEITAPADDIWKVAEDGTVTADILLVPCGVTSFKIDVYLDNDHYLLTVTVPGTMNNNYLYRCNINQQGKDMALTGIYRMPLEDIVITNKDADKNDHPFPSAPPEGAISIPGIPFFIAPGNLIAYKVGSDPEWHYRFAAEQGFMSMGYVNDTSSSIIHPCRNAQGELYSEYFEWRALTPEIGAGKTSADEPYEDPCQKISTEWHTPTLKHASYFVYLREVGDTWKNGKGQDIARVRFLSDQQISSYTIFTFANQNQFLCLPYVGYRKDEKISMLYDGLYWVKDIYTGSPTDIGTAFRANSGGTGNYHLTTDYGCAIRCVTDFLNDAAAPW